MNTQVATHYDVLQVSRRSEQADLRAAYRRMAQRYHPDKLGGSRDAERVMAALNEAYAVLSDPERRAAYDRQIELYALPRRRISELRIKDKAWPWWLLFATISFCALAIGTSLYHGYSRHGHAAPVLRAPS